MVQADVVDALTKALAGDVVQHMGGSGAQQAAPAAQAAQAAQAVAS